MAAATLLLADDSITIQRVIELTFADEQVRVIAAADGQQAIQRIDQDRPDIVLADVGMPKVDGYGVATYVKKTPALQHIPVLLLTGAFAPIDESRARATGCDGVLVKPFEPEKLIERVKELLAGTRSADLWPADMPRVDPPATVPAFAQPIAPTPTVPTPPIAPTPTVPTPPIALAPPPPPAPQPVRDVPPAPIEVAPPPVVVRRAEPVVPPPPSPAPPVTPQAAGARFLEPPPPAARVAPATRLAPPADALDSQLDMLDMALSKLEPTASPHELDAATASDFARDLQALRQPGGADLPPVTPESAPAPRGAFGDWDLPAVPAARTNDLMDFGLPPRGAPNGAMTGAMSDAINDAIDLDPIELPAATAGPAPLPLPTSVPSVPPTDVVPLPVAPPPAAAAPPLPPKPTLAGAFSALLAAERAQPAPRPAAVTAAVNTEAVVEEVVKRVLARMNDDAVQRVVLDAAERIIREEIDKLKAPSSANPR